MNNLNKIDPQISKFNLSNLTNKLLFGKSYFKNKSNILILEATVDYILSKIRFDKPFF